MQYKHVEVASRYLFLTLAAGCVFLLSALPTQASADEISTQTKQLLPPNSGNTCQPVAASNFTAFIYDGALNSFEFTLPDTSYVAIGGSVGNTFISFQYITHRLDASGNMRIHVDTDSTPVRAGLPVSITLLSAGGGGKPTCALIVAGIVNSAGAITPASSPVSVPAQQGTSQPVATNAKKPLAEAPAPAASTDQSGAGAQGANVSGETSGSADAALAAASISPVQSIKDRLFAACAGAGATRIWLVLLALYALAVLALAFGQPETLLRKYPLEWITAAIVIPLLLLLLFWYLVESCRVSLWAPVFALLIAAAGVVIAHRNHPKVLQVIHLPAAAKKT